MFIRLSTAFVMLFGLTALVGATVPVPGKRDNVARVAQVSLVSRRAFQTHRVMYAARTSLEQPRNPIRTYPKVTGRAQALLYGPSGQLLYGIEPVYRTSHKESQVE
ncbi:hypothetical protein DFJ58DRAFT_840597 [Suillus subalutaceus]|uniref:uncharacterized protein n=1 Tax=Suillus subalutaceus TaxID=48586 RepID=UPI001B879F4D|nr:uncharacterized protein DFJ58DRAFT_840597 [Suillus subalutaceus]KAG1857749.1 hypothetical protein DFJ58DRAFT_840597 [Suillus subalutaceus]